MSSCNLHNPTRNVNTELSHDTIRALWTQHLSAESLAPAGLRIGLAKARTALLDTIPAWCLPAFLDSLQTKGGLS